MLYKVLADLIVVLHFGWILFLLTGFILILAGFWWRRFFDLWLFRTSLSAQICLSTNGSAGK